MLDLLIAPLATLPTVLVLGSARTQLTIPNTPQLSGAKIYSQAVVLTPGANSLGAISSQGVTATIGVR